jgi:hypothetical protein
MIKKFRDKDPPPQPKLANPISTITALSKNYRMTPHLEAVTDLVIITFLYLLQVGEYTMPHRARTKRTSPFGTATLGCGIREKSFHTWRGYRHSCEQTVPPY